MTADTLMAGQVSLLLTGVGDLVPLPDATIIDCTFSVSAGATGTSTLSFESADLGDDLFNDFFPAAPNATVTIQ